jgi:3-oxoacyl-[acyl-carrier-protein] synthase I
MNVRPLAILKTGLMTAVGSDAPSCCASFRSKLNNPSPTRFMDSTGEWIMAHQVTLQEKERGLARLARMAATVIDEAMTDVRRTEWPAIPLLLCVAEQERPGRQEGLDDRLLDQIQDLLGMRFAARSAVVAQGRVGVAVALAQARTLMQAESAARVLVVAVDSLLNWSTLMHYDRADRLLRQDNSNGFMPGEGAGALLVGDPTGRAELVCTGVGLGREVAHIDSEEPLRADGLAMAIRAALAEAGQALHDFDYRIADLSGEQYYFKEASLALSRTLHERKEEFDLWHPAECTGEGGALAGAAILALADSACRKAYGKGRNILAHMSNDAGQRAALTIQFRGA